MRRNRTQRAWVADRIVNIASVHGLVASEGKCAYVAAKHGLLGLTKAVALEAARRRHLQRDLPGLGPHRPRRAPDRAHRGRARLRARRGGRQHRQKETPQNRGRPAGLSCRRRASTLSTWAWPGVFSFAS